MRKLAISQAGNAKEPKVVNELSSRFDHFVKNKGDDSKIPADLQQTIFSIGVKYGGAEAYEAALHAHDNPKAPSQKIAAMLALGNAQEPELLKQTFDMIASKARDQDVMYYFAGLANNTKARRDLTQYYKDQYEPVSASFPSFYQQH